MKKIEFMGQFEEDTWNPGKTRCLVTNGPVSFGVNFPDGEPMVIITKADYYKLLAVVETARGVLYSGGSEVSLELTLEKLGMDY